jgi:tetratricopeptide (TPR) repeat protein
LPLLDRNSRNLSVEHQHSTILSFVIMRESKTWPELAEEGAEYFKREQWLEAMNRYTWAIRVKNNVAQLYLNRAMCEMKLKEFDLALEDAETAAVLGLKNISIFCDLAEALSDMQFYTKAMTVCNRGLELDRREPRLLICKHICQQKITSELAISIESQPLVRKVPPAETETKTKVECAGNNDCNPSYTSPL